MAGLTTKYYNLTGGLNRLQGIGTINQSPKQTDTPQSYNVELYKLGGIQTMKGNKQVGNTLTATVTLGHEYTKGSKKYMMVCTADGKIWQYNKITQQYEEVFQFHTPTRRHSAVNFNQGVVFTNGVDDLVYYQYGRNELQDGTITVEDGSKTITGTNTTFTNLSPGDYINIEGLETPYIIDSIESDTSMDVTEAITLPEQQEQQFYGWVYNGVVLYTTTNSNNAGNVDVYKYQNSKMNKQAFTGNIVEGSLQITSGTEEIVTRTVTDYYCYTIHEDSGYEVVSVIRGYVYLPANPRLGSNLFTIPTASTISGIQSITNFPQATTASEVSEPTSITYQSGTKVNLTVFSTNGGKANVFSLNGNTSSRYGSLTYYSSGDLTHTVQETISTQTTTIYTRDTSSDTTVIVATSGLEFYLGPLSLLNATYINSDDASVREEVRGLSLNTWQGRLFVGGNDGTLYYSEVGLIHGWDLKYGAGAIPMFYNDNSDFAGLGIYGTYLVIHRKDYTYYLEPGATGDPSGWKLVPFADISCDSQQSWLSVGNAYYVYSRLHQGVYPLMRRTIFLNNYLGNEISQKITDDFELLNTSSYDKIFPVYEPLKNYMMFYVPMLQGKGSNYCYCYDTISKSWWLRIVPQNVSIAFRFDNKVYIGTTDGQVLEEFKGLTFNGEPIEFSYRTPWFTFGDGTNYLSTREFRVKLDTEMTNHFQVRNRRDGAESYRKRDVSDNKGPVDSLIWDIGVTGTAEILNDETLTDTTWDNFEWVDTGYLVKRFPLPDQFFQSEQIEFYGNKLDDGMAICGFEFDRAELEEVPW